MNRIEPTETAVRPAPSKLYLTIESFVVALENFSARMGKLPMRQIATALLVRAASLCLTYFYYHEYIK